MMLLVVKVLDEVVVSCFPTSEWIISGYCDLDASRRPIAKSKRAFLPLWKMKKIAPVCFKWGMIITGFYLGIKTLLQTAFQLVSCSFVK